MTHDVLCVFTTARATVRAASGFLWLWKRAVLWRTTCKLCGKIDREAADAAADAVSGFFETVGMPLRLRDVGVPEEGIEDIARDALTDFGLHRNVRPINDATELRDLLRAAW